MASLDTSSTCIDLSFTSQPKFVMDSGVHMWIVIIWSFLQNSICKYITLHPTKELCGIISMQTQIISEKLYAASIAKSLLQKKTQMKWSMFSMKLYLMF